MSCADRRPSTSRDDLLASCEWITNAHAAQDPHQAALALVGLYRYLADHGWIAPPRSLLALQMHAAAMDAGLHNLLAPHASAADGLAGDAAASTSSCARG